MVNCYIDVVSSIKYLKYEIRGLLRFFNKSRTIIKKDSIDTNWCNPVVELKISVRNLHLEVG